MTAKEILKELEGYGNEATKNIFIKHGAKEPFFGVKVQDLKKIQKKVKKNHELSMEPYATGNSDAMYLAGLIADETKISKADLNRWVNEAYWYMISEYTVPWIAAESPYGYDLAFDWINSDIDGIASSGWATLSYYTMITQDDVLDIDAYSKLLDRVDSNIHNAQNRERFAMNAFVIGIGTSIKELSDKASGIAGKIGKVNVDMGGTACKVPLATEYIKKVIDRGSLGKKRKSVRS